MNTREAMQLKRRQVRTIVQAVSRNIAYSTLHYTADDWANTRHTGEYWTGEFFGGNAWGKAHRAAYFAAVTTPDSRDAWLTRRAMQMGGVRKNVCDAIHRAELLGQL